MLLPQRRHVFDGLAMILIAWNRPFQIDGVPQPDSAGSQSCGRFLPADPGNYYDTCGWSNLRKCRK
jgi:hypothetical protein